MITHSSRVWPLALCILAIHLTNAVAQTNNAATTTSYNTPQEAISFNGELYATLPSGGYHLPGGYTISPSGSPVTIGGTTYSLLESNTIDINGVTTTIPTANPTTTTMSSEAMATTSSVQSSMASATAASTSASATTSTGAAALMKPGVLMGFAGFVARAVL